MKTDLFFEKIEIFGIFLYFFLTVFNNEIYGVSISDILIPFIVIVISFLYRKKFKLNKIQLFKKENMVLILLYFICFFSTFFSRIVKIQSDLFSLLLFMILYSIITYDELCVKRFECIMQGHCFVCFISSAFIIINVLKGEMSGWNRYSMKIFGIVKDEIYLTSFFVPTILFLLIKLLKCKQTFLEKFFSIFVGVVIVVAIFATGCRSTSVTVIISIIVFMTSFIKPTKKSNLKFMAIITFLLAISYILLPKILPQETLKRITNTESYSSDIRFVIWIYALKLFPSRPLFGSGLNAATTYTKSVIGKATHNIFIDIIINFGIIGFLCIILFVLFSIKPLKKGEVGMKFSFLISCFLPMMFINGFATTTFWTPVILFSIFSKWVDFRFNKSQYLIRI